MNRIKQYLFVFAITITLLLSGCADILTEGMDGMVTEEAYGQEEGEYPAYSGEAYIEINGNRPYFTEEDFTEQSFEQYSDLDELGRCGVAFANVGRDLMPTEERGSISRVKPSGWQSVKYDIVEGRYLYNRCHLIGYQLTAENANEKNLITGTRYLNIEGMLPFEEQVAEYVKETGNHVLYRVTPIFEEDNLLASGVLMEGQSVEDDEISFCIYAYNVQPGIVIDYANGDSALANIEEEETEGSRYILNTSTKKFHLPSCSSAENTKKENKEEFVGNREDLLEQGYEPCGKCNP